MLTKMSLVPSREATSKKKISLADIFLDRLPVLGILKTTGRGAWKKIHIGSRIRIRRKITGAQRNDQTILILPFRAVVKIGTRPEAEREMFFSRVASGNTVLLILAQGERLPAGVKKQIDDHHLPVAVSHFSEHLLESRVKAILTEKIRNRITLHGVAAVIQGRGVLITGASGIGKTTAALGCMSGGDVWVADDLVMVSRKSNGQLFLSGHRKIKKFISTPETGIIPSEHVLKDGQIKKSARLDVALDVVRANGRGHSVQLGDTKIMGAHLPLINLTIPQTGYLNKNLLRKTLRNSKRPDQ